MAQSLIDEGLVVPPSVRHLPPPHVDFGPPTCHPGVLFHFGTGDCPHPDHYSERKFRIQSRVIQDLDPKLDLSNQVEVRRQIEGIFGKVIDEVIDEEGLDFALTRAQRVRMLEQITDEIIGLGPLEPLLRDESITEVMVNGPRQVDSDNA